MNTRDLCRTRTAEDASIKTSQPDSLINYTDRNIWRRTQHISDSILRHKCSLVIIVKNNHNSKRCAGTETPGTVSRQTPNCPLLSHLPELTHSCCSYLQDARMPMGCGAGEEDRTECRCLEKITFHSIRRGTKNIQKEIRNRKKEEHKGSADQGEKIKGYTEERSVERGKEEKCRGCCLERVLKL